MTPLAAAADSRRQLPVVAVAGRPNVGKSTLVNRFVGRRAAVVEERPGVTRDRLELEAEWNGRRFVIVDTGGWLGSGDSLDAKVSEQAQRAVAAADLVLHVVDAAVGVTTEDEDVARMVHRSRRPVLLVANKVDNERREAEAWALLSLGHGDPHMVSALHGRGTGDLLDEVVRHLPDDLGEPESAGPAPAPAAAAPAAAAPGRPGGTGPPLAPSVDGEPPAAAGTSTFSAGARVDEEASPPRVALVGRPNVGKSTLFNRLIGEERSVVHDMPGTTRDAVDTLVDTPDGRIRFVDTAGMRRKSRTEDGTEYFALVRALAALDAADVAMLVIDATEGVTHQDQRLGERIAASGSPVVVVLNKWELVGTDERPQVLADVEDRLAFLGESPVLKISARTGLGVHRLLPALRQAMEAYQRRIPTGELNRALRSFQSDHPAPGSRIRYGVQGAVEPPTFTLFATRRLAPTYVRYLERRLREEFGIGPTPIKIRVRLRS